MSKRKRPTTLDKIQDRAAKKPVPKTSAKKSRASNRIMADTPDGMKSEVLAIAEAHDCTVGSLVAYFIELGLKDYQEGLIDIDSMLVPIRSTKARHAVMFEYTPPPH